MRPRLGDWWSPVQIRPPRPIPDRLLADRLPQRAASDERKGAQRRLPSGLTDPTQGTALTWPVISMKIIPMTVSATRIPLLLLHNGPPVRRVPLALARRFFQICTSASAGAVGEAGLTPLEFAVMAYLNQYDGEPDLDQTALAARLGVDRNTTSLLVGNLESKGLLERRVSSSDRRLRLLRLTHAGEDLFADVNPRAIEVQERILDGLEPRERDVLMDLLVRVIEANPALARPGAGRRRRRVNGRAA